MNDLRETLESIYEIFDTVYLIWLIFLYYIAVKKCFWKKGKSRIKLFLVTLVFNPIAFFALSAYAGPRLFSKLLQILGITP